jgi:hypothetical protein
VAKDFRSIFGVDTFIEALSGIGILAMVLWIRQNPETLRSHFERTALWVDGLHLYVDRSAGFKFDLLIDRLWAR